MIAITPKQMIGDFSSYQDLYDKIYGQKLEEFRTSPYAVAAQLPNALANAGKDIYSIWQWEEDRDRQNELDAKQEELQEKEAQEADVRRQYYADEMRRRNEAEQRRAQLRAKLKTMTPAEQKQYAPYLDLYDMGVLL